MFKILNNYKLLSKFHYATTDVFLKEFEMYIYDRIEYKARTQLIKNLTNLIDKDKIIDCKKIFKKHEFDILYRDFILLPPHRLKSKKKRYSMNNHNDTISWLAIIDYCKKNSESCEYEFWSNDSDFFTKMEILKNEFYTHTKKEITFKTFYPIEIFENEYKTMQFESLHSWFTSFSEIIDAESKKERYDISFKICDIFLKKNKYTTNHPIKTIIGLLKQKDCYYTDINRWFIDFYKKISNYEFLKKLKLKNGNQYYKKDEIKNFLKKFSYLNCL